MISQLVNGTARLSDRAERTLEKVLAKVPEQRRPLATRLLRATAVGDAIGCTTEFQSRAEAAATVEQNRSRGYPSVPVGGGPFNWDAGDITDDTEMACAVLEALTREQTPSLETFAGCYLDWLRTGPLDAGMTIRRVLGKIAQGTPPFGAALADYKARPSNAANGSLMRMGALVAMADSWERAQILALRQGIVTHAHPECALCCGIHADLVYQSCHAPSAARDDLPARAEQSVHRVTAFFTSCDEPVASDWRRMVGRDGISRAAEVVASMVCKSNVLGAADRLTAANQGWVTLSLAFAIASTHKAINCAGDECGVDARTPNERPGAMDRTFGAIAALGHDSDTYAAIAGPILASIV